MNIYNLEKQATPAPWTVDEAQPSWPMHDLEHDGVWFTNLEESNAVLAAHCRNNFMKALEALKQLDTMCREDSRFMVTSDGRVHDLVERTIAELEEVKP